MPDERLHETDPQHDEHHSNEEAPPQPNAQHAPEQTSWSSVDFLKAFLGDAAWPLVAIRSGEPIKFMTPVAAPKREVGVSSWVREWNSKGYGIYYSVNRLKTTAAKKASKADVAVVTHLHIDIDPPGNKMAGADLDSWRAAKLAELTTGTPDSIPPPTWLIDSGRGFQLLWRLNEPLPVDGAGGEKTTHVEALNRGLARAFDADINVVNIDRVLRLPGTVNTKPEAAGRLVRVIEHHPERIYGADAFKPVHDANKGNSAGGKDDATAEGEALPAVDLDALEAAIAIIGKAKVKQVLDAIREGHAEGLTFKSRSEAVWFVAKQLARANVAPELMLAVLLDPELKISEHVHAQSNPRAYAQRQVKKAIAKAVPIIRCRAGFIHKMTDDAEAALLKAGAEVYERSFKLVQPLFREVDAADKRKTTTIILDAPDLYVLNDKLAPSAEFRKYDGRSNDWRRVDPPKDVVRTILARKGSAFHSVIGVTTAPLMRPDGSLNTKSGYDPATSMYLKVDAGLDLSTLKAQPSKDDAIEALALLNELLDEFTFITEIDRSVALSLFMTATLRASMSVAPFHLIRAHKSGTGKSFLVDIAGGILTGTWTPVIDMKREGDEIGKRLEAVLRQGSPLISLDNLEGDMGGPALCIVTERPVIDLRILGKTETMRIESRSAFAGTGNNVVPTRDFVRRILTADIDSDAERPELRKFKSNPLRTVLTNRGLYMAAIFTITRAFRLSNSPPLGQPLGSYGEYDALVRGPLVWLGREDPVGSMEKVRDNDPEYRDMLQLFHWWKEIPSLGVDTPRKARELLAVAETMTEANNLSGPPPKLVYPDLRDVVMRHCGRKGDSSPTKALSRWLGSIEGKIARGCCLSVATDKRDHTHVFTLKQAKSNVTLP